jgi:hypothetical protein
MRLCLKNDRKIMVRSFVNFIPDFSLKNIFQFSLSCWHGQDLNAWSKDYELNVLPLLLGPFLTLFTTYAWPNPHIETQTQNLSQNMKLSNASFILWPRLSLNSSSAAYSVSTQSQLSLHSISILNSVSTQSQLSCRSRYVLFLVETSKLWTVIIVP